MTLNKLLKMNSSSISEAPKTKRVHKKKNTNDTNDVPTTTRVYKKKTTDDTNEAPKTTRVYKKKITDDTNDAPTTRVYKKKSTDDTNEAPTTTRVYKKKITDDTNEAPKTTRVYKKKVVDGTNEAPTTTRVYKKKVVDGTNEAPTTTRVYKKKALDDTSDAPKTKRVYKKKVVDGTNEAPTKRTYKRNTTGGSNQTKKKSISTEQHSTYIYHGLSDVLNAKTIKDKEEIFKACRDHYYGKQIYRLNDADKQIFLSLYEQSGKSIDNIKTISIKKHPKFGGVGFWIKYNKDNEHRCRKEKSYPVKISTLCGRKPKTDYGSYKSAMRYAVSRQITFFRKTHPLDPEAICPITGHALGTNAQVDHVVPFSVLCDNWRETQQGDVFFIFNKRSGCNRLKEPWNTRWKLYHKTHAVLRWVSYDGNKIAHRL